MIKSKLESWHNFTLSIAGRLSLIISVIQGSFLHSFQIYRCPSSLLKELNAAIKNFFWTRLIHHRKTIQVAWDFFWRPKEEGGLGIKDLHVLNKWC